tara:strand:- start:876 stop:1136 length:261 start_codon:yes stop_codon:yes gene_type:complete
MTRSAKYVIVRQKVIKTIDFDSKVGRYNVYLTKKQSIRYNKNKYFFQFKKGIIKFRGQTPKELEGYVLYNVEQISKILKSRQWKLN